MTLQKRSMTSLKKCINKIDHREHKIKMETENYPQEEIGEFCLHRSQKFEFRGAHSRLSRFREGNKTVSYETKCGCRHLHVSKYNESPVSWNFSKNSGSLCKS